MHYFTWENVVVNILKQGETVGSNGKINLYAAWSDLKPSEEKRQKLLFSYIFELLLLCVICMTFKKGRKQSEKTKRKIGEKIREIDLKEFGRLYNIGLSDREISKELKTCVSNVYYWRRKLKLPNLGHRKDCQCGSCRAERGESYNLGRRGEEVHNWKGDIVGYSALHEWIKRNKPKPVFCEICTERAPAELANKSQEYMRDIDDFWWACGSCHRRIDEPYKNTKRDERGKFIKNGIRNI